MSLPPPPGSRPNFWVTMVDAWTYVFPALEYRTDRVVRRLLLADLFFLIYVSVMAYDSAVVFTAFIAANALGAIGGLLFAVPKQAAVANSQTTSGPKIAIIANTSLEEVSDWLTKTIIGAGLVSWRQILAQLDYSGKVIGHAITPADSNIAWSGGVALILGPSALGALIAYLWFARHWPSELAGSSVSAHKILFASGQVQEKEPVAPAKPNIPPPAPEEPPPSQPPSTNGMAFAPEAEPEEGEARDVAPEQVETQKEGDQTRQASAGLLLRKAVDLKYAQMRSAPLYHHDWARRMFGQSSAVTSAFGTRALSASVRKLDPDWFEIKLEVTASPKPDTEAIFFLHNTFSQPTPTVGFDAEGIARLKITAYGAFTVGVLTDDGTTELELNLAEIAQTPSEFRNR